MSTFYLDPWRGNDNNNGALTGVWRTFRSGATAARLAWGDTVRVAATDVERIATSGQWTYGLGYVELGEPLTTGLQLCNSGWTAVPNVTASNAGRVRRKGLFATSLVFAAGFTSGYAAGAALHNNTGTPVDASAWNQVSFWFRTTTSLPTGVFSLRLCTDNTGTAGAHRFDIPAIPCINTWVPLTYRVAGGLTGALRSVSLWAHVDPGTPTVYIDNIIGCRDTGDCRELHFKKFIGGHPNRMHFYPISAISGTRVWLDMAPDAIPTNDGGFSGFLGPSYTGAITTITPYPVELNPVQNQAIANVWASLVDSGNDYAATGGWITFDGGYDPATFTTKIGRTILDFQCGWAGLFASSNFFTNVINIDIYRGFYGVYFSQTYFNFFSGCNFIGNSSVGVNFSPPASNITFNNCIFARNMQAGIIPACSNFILKNSSGIYENQQYGIYGSVGESQLFQNVSEIRNYYESDVNYLANFSPTNAIFENCKFTRPSESGRPILPGQTNMTFKNCTFTNPTGIFFSYSYDNRVVLINDSGINGNHRIITDGMEMRSSYDFVRTPGSQSWELKTYSGIRGPAYPFTHVIAKAFFKPFQTVTASLWFYRLSGFPMGLRTNAGNLGGDYYYSYTTGTGQWIRTTIDFTPETSGVADIEVFAWASGAVGGRRLGYFDDFSLTAT